MSWISIDESLASRWDEFVEAQPAARMVHLLGFKKAVEETYHLEPFYRAYVERERIRAVFPGFFHKSVIYGKKILSQPFSEYGGIVLSAEAGATEKDEILEEFSRTAKSVLRIKHFDHLEMRNPMSLEAGLSPDFRSVRLFKRAVRRLEAPEAMWKSLAAKDRNVIQRARDFGLSISDERSDKSLRRDLYPLYLKTMKRLGTPPHPPGYFLRLSQTLGDRMRVLVVRFRETPLAAVVGWGVGRTVHITDMCSDSAAFFLRPNDLAVWEFMCRAQESGFEVFDFGPVRYRGQEIFKKKWKMELRDYFHVYVSIAPDRIRSPFSSSGGIMSAAPAVWRSAVPTGPGCWIGKYLRKQVGL